MVAVVCVALHAGSSMVDGCGRTCDPSCGFIDGRWLRSYVWPFMRVHQWSMVAVVRVALHAGSSMVDGRGRTSGPSAGSSVVDGCDGTRILVKLADGFIDSRGL